MPVVTGDLVHQSPKGSCLMQQLIKIKDLYIQANSDKPEIDFKFSNNTLTMSGESYPENGVEFFRPIMDELNGYLSTLNNIAIEFNFKLVYFNSVSAKFFFSLFGSLNEYAKSNPDCVTLNWMHHEDDDTMLEFGEDLHEDFPEITFNPVVNKG